MTAETVFLRYAVIYADPGDDLTDVAVTLTVHGRDDTDDATAAAMHGGTAVALRWAQEGGDDLDGQPLWWLLISEEADWCPDGTTLTAGVHSPEAIEEACAGRDDLMVLSAWQVS